MLGAAAACGVRICGDAAGEAGGANADRRMSSIATSRSLLVLPLLLLLLLAASGDESSSSVVPVVPMSPMSASSLPVLPVLLLLALLRFRRLAAPCSAACSPLPADAAATDPRLRFWPVRGAPTQRLTKTKKTVNRRWCHLLQVFASRCEALAVCGPSSERSSSGCKTKAARRTKRAVWKSATRAKQRLARVPGWFLRFGFCRLRCLLSAAAQRHCM